MGEAKTQDDGEERKSVASSPIAESKEKDEISVARSARQATGPESTDSRFDNLTEKMRTANPRYAQRDLQGGAGRRQKWEEGYRAAYEEWSSRWLFEACFWVL